MADTTFTDLARRDMERHLLVAVDESDNARRAVMYLADFFSNNRDVFVTLLTVIIDPSEDYFASEEERQQWLADKQAVVDESQASYRALLLDAGFAPEQIATRVVVRADVSIGDAILAEQERLRCCIVVVGRRGISHSEEFVFGSTSSKILHSAQQCAVMVVE